MPPSEADITFRLQDAGLYGLEGRHFLMSDHRAMGACGRTVMVKEVHVDAAPPGKEWAFSLTLTPKDGSGRKHPDERMTRTIWRALVAEGNVVEVSWPPQDSKISLLW